MEYPLKYCHTFPFVHGYNHDINVFSEEGRCLIYIGIYSVIIVKCMRSVCHIKVTVFIHVQEQPEKIYC